MPRKSTGGILWEQDHYVARITLDGKRERIHLPSGLSDAKAKATAEYLAENPAIARAKLAEQKAEKSNIAPIPKGETFVEYLERWLAERDKRGSSSVYSDRLGIHKHIVPHIGDKPIAAITKEDLEKLVQVFDNQIANGECSWRTPRRWWGLVCKLFSDASKSKNLALRVREDNPVRDVQGPDGGDDKVKAFLFPNEFLQFVSCRKIRLTLRRVVTLAIYLYCRTSEVLRLRWEDIDMERGIVTICRSWDRERKQEKSTKGKRPRTFRIEPELMPLLRALYAERDSSGRVFSTGPHHFAARFRNALKRAGITRPDLFASDDQHLRIRFHDLRATGITWMAIRGDSLQLIMQRAGHRDFGTTQMYVRQAEALGNTAGQPFPPLPACLLSTEASGDDGGPNGHGERSDGLGGRSEAPMIAALSQNESRLWRSGENGPNENETAANGIMSDGAIVPSTVRNYAMSGHVTVSRPNQPDDLSIAFGAIRDAVARGDHDATKRAWVDLGALLGIAQDAPQSSVKRPRKRSA